MLTIDEELAGAVESVCVALKKKKYMFMPCIRRRQWHPTPVLLPGKSHGWRSLEGCSLWGR